MPDAVPPLTFATVLNAPGMWRALENTHGLSRRDLQWLAHVQLATHALRSQQTPAMLAHRVMLNTEAPPAIPLAGSFILSSTPDDRAFILYTPFDGLKKFASLADLTRHLETHLNRADEDDRLLAFLAIEQRKHLVEKRAITVTWQLIEGDVFDDQRIAIEDALQLNAWAVLEELLQLPALDSLLETMLKKMLERTMPGIDQALTRVSVRTPEDSHFPESPARHGRDAITLGMAILLRYRHSTWPEGEHYFHLQQTPQPGDQDHWKNAVNTVAGKLLIALYEEMEGYWNAASADGASRRTFFSQVIRDQARADFLLKREAGIVDAQKFDLLLSSTGIQGNAGPRATLETVRLWEHQANYIELAGSLMISHTDACLYTPAEGLQVLKDYNDLKATLLSKFSSAGHEDELYGLLGLEERQQFLGFDRPHVSGEPIGGEVFSALMEAIITKQRRNIEYALQIYRHSDGVVDIRALFDKALDIRSMIDARLLPLDTLGRWSTRPMLLGKHRLSIVKADAAAADAKTFASVLAPVSRDFAAQPLANRSSQQEYLQTLLARLSHALFVGITGEARLRVLNGTLRHHEQAIIDSVFHPDQPQRNSRKGLNGFRPDAWVLTLRVTDQDAPLPLANCVLLTERGGLDEQHSGRTVLWTPALGLELFESLASARQALNRRLLEPEHSLCLLENLSPAVNVMHRRFILGPLQLMTDNVLRNRTQSAIDQHLERCEALRKLKLPARNQARALAALVRSGIDSNLQRALALAKAFVKRQSLPVWLSTAPIDEQQLHLELLEQWRNSVIDDKDYLHALPTVRDYLQQTLTSLLGSHLQMPGINPEHIRIIPALTLAGPALNLTDFALHHAHNAGSIDFSVRSNTAQALPATLDRKAVRELLALLHIYPTYAGRVTASLTADDTEASLRKQRFVRQLPWQLLQHAHQLKLQQSLSAPAFDLLAQVLDMPDAIARAAVVGACALIRPLELIKTPGATAIKASGLYLTGPADGQPGPQILYSPYYSEQVFHEFENESAVIAALNQPGALQDLLIRRLPESQRASFTALLKASAGQVSEMTLANNPITGNLLHRLYDDNLSLLPHLLASHSSTSAQSDWAAARHLFSSGISLISGVLPGKLAYGRFLWQSYKDAKASAEALQDHHWKHALESFIAGAAELVTLGRLSMKPSPDVSEATTEVAPVVTAPAEPQWKDIRPTAPSRTQLQPFEALTVALSNLRQNPADGTYTDLASKAMYAAVAGKVYPVERPGAVWQIKGADEAGPVLRHTASRQLVLDTDQHTVHFGKALSKMYNRYANDRETRLWLNIEAQGMEQIRARHPEKARMLTHAVDLARYYAFNSLHNLGQLRIHAPGTRLERFFRHFFDVARIDADLLAKVKAATLPICNALVDPSDDLMNTDRFVVGSNKYRQTRLIAFVLDDDARRRVHFTERFFNPELDWYTAGLTEPFNVLAHAQAATLIHEFAHQCTKAVDIASLEARRPFADLIATVTGYGAAMKQSQTQFQREALSLATPREELFARWNYELGKWVSLDSIPGTQHVGEEILKVTASKTIEQARGAFLNPTNPAARIDTILRNADSIAFLICEMGRQLDPVTVSVEGLD